jgi:TRAP-type uncharacterized transport system substrate-binding protein
MRVNFLVQVAHAMSLDRSSPKRPFSDMRVTLGSIQSGTYQRALTFANGDYLLINDVVSGELDLAAINPASYLTMAHRGTGPFSAPQPVSVIATMPTHDVMLFAVSEKTGLRSIAEIKERKYPLKLSIRRALEHGTRFLIDHVLEANGFSLKDLESWGAQIAWTETPNGPDRLDAMRDGSLDAVFDEGVKGWGIVAAQQHMTFLPLDPAAKQRLDDFGWALEPVQPLFADAPPDMLAPSFSGWPVFTRTDLPDEVAYQMAKAVDSAWPRMVYDWEEERPPVLADICEGTIEAPRDVPLHPGAARYYRERGCKV